MTLSIKVGKKISSILKCEKQLLFVTYLFVAIFAAPAILSLADHSLAGQGIEPGDGVSEVTLGPEFGIKGFVVSDVGGNDSKFRHVSIIELETLLEELAPTPFFPDVHDWVAREGDVALFLAYAPEITSNIAYYIGPAEIIKNSDVRMWRVKMENLTQDNTGRLSIVSSDPIEIAQSSD